jgi:hypothetical protein
MRCAFVADAKFRFNASVTLGKFEMQGKSQAAVPADDEIRIAALSMNGQRVLTLSV